MCEVAPGTSFKIIGTASQGEHFEITGKNLGLNDWWQIEYNGHIGWVFGDLGTATSEYLVTVASNIPATPVATAKPVPTRTRIVAAPTRTRRPTRTPEPVYSIDLRSLLRNVENFIGEEVYIEAEVIQVVGPQVEYAIIVFDGEGYAYLTYDNAPFRIISGDIVAFTAEVSGIHTYISVLGTEATVPLLYVLRLTVLN